MQKQINSISNINVTSYNPSKWGKDEIIQALMVMKTTDKNGFSAYLGNADKKDLEKAIVSFSYNKLNSGARKYDGGYEFDLVINHNFTENKNEILEHMFIVTPVVSYTEDSHISIDLEFNIFDGHDVDSFKF